MLIVVFCFVGWLCLLFLWFFVWVLEVWIILLVGFGMKMKLGIRDIGLVMVLVLILMLMLVEKVEGKLMMVYCCIVFYFILDVRLLVFVVLLWGISIVRLLFFCC